MSQSRSIRSFACVVPILVLMMATIPAAAQTCSNSCGIALADCSAAAAAASLFCNILGDPLSCGSDYLTVAGYCQDVFNSCLTPCPPLPKLHPQAAYYVSSNQHVYELYWGGQFWMRGDITAVTGNTLTASSSRVSSWINSAGGHAVYYVGTSQHVYELYWDGNQWTKADLTAATGNTLALSTSPLTSFNTAGGGHAVYYLGSNQHVYELYWNGSSWSNGDVTAATGNTLASSTGGLTSWLNSAGAHATYFVGANQHIYELYWNGSTWTKADLTAATGNTLASTGTQLTGFNTTGGGHAIYYLGTNQHVYELYWNGSSWSNGDVTAATGNTLASSTGGLTSFLDSGGGHATYYVGANQHVYELYWNGSAWTNGDLSAVTGNTLAQLGSAVTCFSTGFGHAVYFIATDQHVYELYWDGSAWNKADLTAATSGALASMKGLASFWRN
jgi:hypothetical protein